MNNYPFLPYQSLSLTLLAVLSILSPQKVHAGAIEISVDPYNNSGYGITSPENNTTYLNNNSPKNNDFPFTNAPISTESIYYIKGNTTPPSPTIVNGNLVTSNQSLPAIPNIGEPYSPQQNAEVNPRNITPSNNPSVSVSPFDETPQENKPLNSVTSLSSNNIPINNIQTNNNGVRTINLSPENPNTNSTAINTNPDNSSANNLDKRRNLREILVLSNPVNATSTENNNNNGNNQPSVSIVAPSTVSNPTVFKVLAQVTDNTQQAGVKSLYPEAFTTNYQGKSLLQVGVFSSKERAQQVSQSLANIGVRAIILN